MTWTKAFGISVLTWFVFLAVLLLFGEPAHAQTAAEKAFGRWERVTPETIRQPVPEWTYPASYGSVTNEYRKHGPAGPARALPLSLPSAPARAEGLTNLLKGE